MGIMIFIFIILILAIVGVAFCIFMDYPKSEFHNDSNNFSEKENK